MSLESWARGEAGQWTIRDSVLAGGQMKQDKSPCQHLPGDSRVEHL